MRHKVGGGLSRPRAARGGDYPPCSLLSGGSWLRARAVACGCWKTSGLAATLAQRKQVTSQCPFGLRAVCVRRGHAATAQAPARRKVQVHGHVYKKPRSPELSEEHIWPCTCAFRRAGACAVSACPVRNTHEASRARASLRIRACGCAGDAEERQEIVPGVSHSEIAACCRVLDALSKNMPLVTSPLLSVPSAPLVPCVCVCVFVCVCVCVCVCEAEFSPSITTSTLLLCSGDIEPGPQRAAEEPDTLRPGRECQAFRGYVQGRQ
jgi:hypothetical protein